ncbi:hypothetical protein [Mailhella massiliensis]|uniref:hypothetical protein n=1 Tax=Mailhella massiliensis TaxID=1903261 RepID=UPI0023F43979|nr:hypothetical protein [Mailhella massiliensis]
MDRFLELLSVIVSALASALEKYRSKSRQDYADSVRSDGAGSWLRRFGGKDRRAADNPGAIATDAWSYEYQGQTVTVPGEWIHLPASEAAELQLWMEQAGGLL